MSRRRQFNFVIDDDLADGLKTVKERDGVGESEQVRRAVREWLEKKGILGPANKSRPTSRPPAKSGR